MHPGHRPLFASHSDTSAINVKHLVADLFSQMREPSSGTASPKGSTHSLNVTKNAGFQQQNGSEHLPWNSQTISLPGSCNSNLGADSPPSHPPALMRSTSNASALTSLSPDLSLSDSHFFEVLYIGKVRISQRKVPETLIDDALHKFAQHEAEKIKNQRRHSLLSSTGTSLDSDSTSLKDTNDNPIENFAQKTSLIPSTTPLEPDKNVAWRSAENLHKVESTEVDKAFDVFTKERIKKPIVESNSHKKDVIKNNLGTVDEEKHDDIYIGDLPPLHISEPIDDPLPKLNDKENNKVTLNGNLNGNHKVQAHTDPLLSIPVAVSETEDSKKVNFTEISRKPTSNMDSKKQGTPFLRDRSASIGTLNLKTPLAHLIGEQNRTMLFQVGRSELRLISPDRKQILLHRAFRDVASCVLGRTNTEHFGFVCRETNDSYACYVFKCESDGVATELINAIKQAFASHADNLKKNREKSPNATCEHCPMLWYHRLCHDIEGMNDKKMHAFILRRVEQLPEEEQELIITKYQGGTNHMYEVTEHNAFLMMLLRAHCEAKQQRHVHDTAENRSEFLNQYLGGSTIFMKAKRSLSSGFDHLLKRKQSRDDLAIPVAAKKEVSPNPLPAPLSMPPTPPIQETSSETSGPELLSTEAARKSTSPMVNSVSEPSSPKIVIPAVEEVIEGSSECTPVTSPMMDIFLKVSDARPSAAEAGSEPDETWRQAIYNKVVQPPLFESTAGDLTQADLLGKPAASTGKRSREELRQLWKMAIDQTILLVRMEKENARLKEREESSAVRRIKLEYTELGSSEGAVMWDSLLAREPGQPVAKVDRHMLRQAVYQGVPRMSRGGVWYFLAEQASARLPPPDARAAPLYSAPYRALLAGLTKHQHAILIDLGRTFPKHSYFASALGPGQLALYNILKAYSLLDPDVGYCQGLSFVAGVLLLHMEEAEAFSLLRHLMFRRGLRNQYLPDMSALQVQLYQLSRLVRDHEPELHAKLEALDISPALYAAPWMLTLFTSQFPLGFVVRVFDLIFLESLDVVFAVSLALLSVHREGLMMCCGCEEAAEYLKHKLPDVDRAVADKVMKKVHKMDISRQLSEYAVEYGVLREEMPRLAALTEHNQRLLDETERLTAELDNAMDTINSYQKNQTRLETQNKIMEHQLLMLSRYISANQKDLPPEIKKVVQIHAKKISFSSKITSFKFTSNDDEEEKKPHKTGVSSPNLFSKISREDVLNAVNREKNIESDRKHFLMKKSQSVHSGLIATRLKVAEAERKSSLRIDDLANDLKKKTFTTQEQILQERLFEKQLKHDFDENLKKLDEKLTPNYNDDLSIFQSKKSMSLSLKAPKPQETKLPDSGFVTPMSPTERERRDDSSVISHPLSDCDVDIKFDGQSTKLKQIRPLKTNGVAEKKT
ncbi:TBC1 domain family member 4 isoform X2 [Aricia agestis]|uniref:TBC1 domain family member 4 isoform X2 n=1 Tax=Aricia agestis TaxID=91739 RepID=UPI001C202F20|nr:TBC1 domain family member 4 isoform X2 [Aricia agestis]